VPTWVKVPGNALQVRRGTAVTNPDGISTALRTRKHVRKTCSSRVRTRRRAFANVDLTGPYFHNGGKATLMMQVVDFYDDGFRLPVESTLAPLIKPLGLTAAQRRAHRLRSLLTLTDERVRLQKAAVRSSAAVSFRTAITRQVSDKPVRAAGDRRSGRCAAFALPEPESIRTVGSVKGRFLACKESNHGETNHITLNPAGPAEARQRPADCGNRRGAGGPPPGLGPRRRDADQRALQTTGDLCIQRSTRLARSCSNRFTQACPNPVPLRPSNPGQLGRRSRARGIGRGRNPRTGGRQDCDYIKHQVGFDKIPVGTKTIAYPEPLYYRLALQVGEHNFTSSTVLPIQATGSRSDWGLRVTDKITLPGKHPSTGSARHGTFRTRRIFPRRE
jgi:hypothetical protein